MKKILTFFLCLTMTLGTSKAVLAAPDWPSNIVIDAQGGIVIDANSGAVLYGQGMHETFYPASITKVLTALIVLENCKMDEMVYFSQDAVFNVEANSTSASMSPGDKMSVEDCLYALLLQSANEVANALAEHVAGSNEDFCVMMNEKARQLGCEDSNFANPSGLNNPDHKTSAYDMALICKEAFANDDFVRIDSTRTYRLPPSKIAKDGLPIAHHDKMLFPNNENYYPGIIGGKTGYTSLAGNTLVTCAEKNGVKLITVILNGKSSHYSDTKKLLNFGFSNFQSLKAVDYNTAYSATSNDMTIIGLPDPTPDALMLDPESRITLPVGAQFNDVDSQLTYDLSTSDPKDAVAKIIYTYNNRNVGCTYLLINPKALVSVNESSDITASPSSYHPAKAELTATGSSSVAGHMNSPDPKSVNTPEMHTPLQQSDISPLTDPPKEYVIPTAVWIGLAILLVLTLITGAAITIKINLDRKQELELIIRKEKRNQRLKETGVTESEFDSIMAMRHSSQTVKKHPLRGRRRRR